MAEDKQLKDHRDIGHELDLFTTSPLVGGGLPLFTPKGTILRDLLLGFSEKLQKDAGFQKVWIPHIAKTDLYKKSGHWDKFGDELFLVQSQETNNEFVLKPMNCPHHIQIYAYRPRSYREIPVRYYESTTVYRDEKAGELNGLSRVRSITQDDAHIFCNMEQIEEEFTKVLTMIKTFYATLGLEFRARLSFRDPKEPKKYLGDSANWDRAEKILKDVAEKLELDYFIGVGEAAFYGPKIDIMFKDSLGREWQGATEQLDFVMPERFGLSYIDADGSEKGLVMIHKALLGSVERFLSVYLEHTGGAFPTWLSPVQVMIVPISDKNNEYGEKILKELAEAGVRAELDQRAETMQAKIRDAQLQKIPYMVVIGDREQSENKVSVRKRSGENLNGLEFNKFLEDLKLEIEKKA